MSLILKPSAGDTNEYKGGKEQDLTQRWNGVGKEGNTEKRNEQLFHKRGTFNARPCLL